MLRAEQIAKGLGCVRVFLEAKKGSWQEKWYERLGYNYCECCQERSGLIWMKKKLRQMKRYRIYRYGLFDHIFDVQVKKWYGWVLVKRFKADISSDDTMIDNIYYCEMLSKELLEKLEEEL